MAPTTKKPAFTAGALEEARALIWTHRRRLAVGVAAIIDSVTSFANSQILGVAAQRAITDMRKDVEAHVMRLPIRYFDKDFFSKVSPDEQLAHVEPLLKTERYFKF